MLAGSILIVPFIFCLASGCNCKDSMPLSIIAKTIVGHYCISSESIAIPKEVRTQILWSAGPDPRLAAATSCGNYLQHVWTTCRCIL